MKNFRLTTIGGAILLLLLFSCATSPTSVEKPAQPPLEGPEVRFGELFHDVQMAEIFPDSKTFADHTPKFPDEEILRKYEEQKDQADFSLLQFIEVNFEQPPVFGTSFSADTSRSVVNHIERLWPVLTRQPDKESSGTLIALPKPYIVPGGRFREIYYWDSYFTMLGLQVSDSSSGMIRNMIDNFAWLIDTVGFIPNGNRTYYLGRSQPPFFAMMVNLLAETEGEQVLTEYLPALQKEYEFWTEGGITPESGTAAGHLVSLPDGELMNRYYDKFPAPRPESYREDVLLAEESGRDEEDIYGDIRAACESGWDFSSRWFGNPDDMGTIRTTKIIPVDLNSLLYTLEMTLSEAYRLSGNDAESQAFAEAAERRKAAIVKYCWNEEGGYFADYDFERQTPTGVPSLAMMYPLVAGIASEGQAASVATVIEKDFLQPGGVVSTLNPNGQQWDAPNGWAPLQWMTIKGLANYGHAGLANEIKDRWIKLNTGVFQRTGKLVEKYNVMELGLEAGGGEYPNQDGFGWTNGVLRRLIYEEDFTSHFKN